MQPSDQPTQIYRCEFEVASDLVCAKPADAFDLVGCNGFTTTLRNAAIAAKGIATGLVGVVTGPGESLDDAVDRARSALASQLDLLAFATHSRYRIIAPIRAMEWTPGQKKRQIAWFNERDERFPPAPELRAAYLNTAAKLDNAGLPGYLRVALRAFRRGLLEDAPDDQFMSLWLALEVIAENTKAKKRVAIPCTKCKGALTCIECGHTPTRLPMPKDQITKLIEERTGAKHAKGVAKGLFAARNGLMHGRSVRSIELECKASMDVVANALANVVWDALYKITAGYDSEGKILHREGQFLSRRHVVVHRGAFAHQGSSPHPAETTIPTTTMEWEFEFRPRNDESPEVDAL